MRSKRNWRFAAIAVVVALVGCAHARPPARPAAQTQAAPLVRRLAVLPVESDAFPELADWLSSLLEDARVAGVDQTFQPKVTLEVVQLAIECVDTTPACYVAAGRSLGASRLLFAQIGGGKRRDHSVRVAVILFDADAGAPLVVADRVFKSQDDALAGAEELVTRAARANR